MSVGRSMRSLRRRKTEGRKERVEGGRVALYMHSVTWYASRWVCVTRGGQVYW